MAEPDPHAKTWETMPIIKHRLAAFAAATAIASAPLLIATPSAEAAPAPRASAAASLACHAEVSDSTPSQYSNVYVHVRTAPRAHVRTVAHYRITDTAHATTANSRGRATIRYYISSSTAGYRVWIDVSVTNNGHSGHCRTSFVAHS